MKGLEKKRTERGRDRKKRKIKGENHAPRGDEKIR